MLSLDHQQVISNQRQMCYKFYFCLIIRKTLSTTTYLFCFYVKKLYLNTFKVDLFIKNKIIQVFQLLAGAKALSAGITTLAKRQVNQTLLFYYATVGIVKIPDIKISLSLLIFNLHKRCLPTIRSFTGVTDETISSEIYYFFMSV